MTSDDDVGQPAFEITLAHGRQIKIWANGRVEGIVGAYIISTNRIHTLIKQAHKAGWDEGKRWGSEHGAQPSIDTDGRD